MYKVTLWENAESVRGSSQFWTNTGDDDDDDGDDGCGTDMRCLARILETGENFKIVGRHNREKTNIKYGKEQLNTREQ